MYDGRAGLALPPGIVMRTSVPGTQTLSLTRALHPDCHALTTSTAVPGQACAAACTALAPAIEATDASRRSLAATWLAT